MIEYEYEYLDYSNNTDYQYKNINKQKISTLRTQKIAYWVFCALITTETLKLRLWVKFILFGFQTSTEYEYEYYSVLKNHRIQIRILFGLKISSEYEYEYHYSVSTIRIPNYSLTSVIAPCLKVIHVIL